MKFFFILFLFLFFLCPISIFAQTKQELCLPKGYTVITINGMNTSKEKAAENKRSLEEKLPKNLKGEKVIVDYVHNPSHLAGAGDIIAVASQKFSEGAIFPDYDLMEMINDASQKVKTQKILLVGHSQGNFYTNTFYDYVKMKSGVPKESIGVYGVATPSSYIAGEGRYITSSTDQVVNKVRWQGILNVLPANEDIELSNTDGTGHSFSGVYLKYRALKIISDIKYSLNKLKASDIADSQKPCIAPPELSWEHKLTGKLLSVVDPAAIILKKSIKDTYNATTLALKKGFTILGNVVATLADGDDAPVITSESSAPGPAEDNPEPQKPQTDTPEENPETEYTKNQTTNQATNVINQTINQTETVEEKHPKKESSGGGADSGGSETEGSVSPLPPPASDITPPVITIEGDNPVTIEIGEVYNDAGATALDDVDGAITIVTEGTVDTSIVGDYEITYTATDLSDNVSTSIRAVIVTDSTPPPTPDTTPPVITLIGGSSMNVDVGSTFNDPGATAVDDVDGDIAPDVSGSVDTGTEGIYIITYTATDLSSNTSTAIRTVVVDMGAKLDQPKSVFVSGDYAYVVSENSNSFEIIDISDPEDPIHKSYLTHGTDGLALFSPKSVFVSGDFAYVVSYSNNLVVIDVSDPTLPVPVGTLNHDPASAKLRCPISINISGDYAYIVSSGCGGGAPGNIEIVDINDPESPAHEVSVPFPLLTTPTSVFVSDNYLYATFSNVGIAGGGLHIFDISNLSSPVLKGILDNGTDGASIDNPQSVSVEGDYAFITSRGASTFEIVNVSNRELPFHEGKISDGSGGAALLAPVSAFVSGDFAYVVSFAGNILEILDVSDRSFPSHIGTIADGEGGADISSPTSVFVSGDYAYITSSMSDALEVVDISDPANPVHAGKILDGGF